MMAENYCVRSAVPLLGKNSLGRPRNAQTSTSHLAPLLILIRGMPRTRKGRDTAEGLKEDYIRMRHPEVRVGEFKEEE